MYDFEIVDGDAVVVSNGVIIYRNFDPDRVHSVGKIINREHESIGSNGLCVYRIVFFAFDVIYGDVQSVIIRLCYGIKFNTGSDEREFCE